jgi:hypothetical protein
VNYYEVTPAAARGDKKALKTFFALHTDGAAAEMHITSVMPVVIHLTFRLEPGLRLTVRSQRIFSVAFSKFG